MLVSGAARSSCQLVRAGARAASSRTAGAAAARTRQPPAASRDAKQTDSYQLADKVKQLVLAATPRRRTITPGSSSTQSQGDSLSPALHLIRTAPTQAATVVVWNVLLNSILTTTNSHGTPTDDAQAVQRAYQVWMEMKRRGVVPTSRSFGTFLTGVAKRAKRAARAAQQQQQQHQQHQSGWNADLRAKVETVHKQWRTHCERVLERHNAVEGRRRREARGKAAAAVTPEDDSLDGKHDSPESLSAVPTNQYLSFLSASLDLCSASVTSPTSTPPPAAAGPLLSHLVQTFEAMPDPDHPDRNGVARLGRTSVSYAIVWGALKSALRLVDAAAGAVSTESMATNQHEQRREIEDGLELLSLGESAPPATTVEALPTAQQILDKALAMWDHLVLHPPTPELPSPSHSPSSADSLSPILPTALISLYLSIPLSASASIPPTTHARFLSLPQISFGFVPPSRIADLEPPHPPTLAQPLCGSTGAMDYAAFGASLRLAMRAAPSAGVSQGAKWTQSWWDQVRDYPERFGLARGLGGEEEGDRSSSSSAGGVLLGEEALRDREAAEVVIKASGRAGDIEVIEDIFSYLKSTVATHPFSCSRSHAPLVSTYLLALSSLSRVGTQPALTSAIRIWNDLLATEPPFVPSPARSSSNGGIGSSEKAEVAKAAYAKGAYELVRMAVMGVRERTAVWAAVKAVSGLEAGRSTSALDPGTTASELPATAARGAFHPLNFPPRSTDGDSVPRRTGGGESKRDAELDQLARILHNALGRILSGDGRPGDLSSQLGQETVKVLEQWRGRIKAFAGIGDRTGGGKGVETSVTATDAADGEMAWRRRQTAEKQAVRERLNGSDRRPRSPARSYSRDRVERDEYRPRRREDGDRRYPAAGRPDSFYEDRPRQSRPSFSAASPSSRPPSRSSEERPYWRY